MGEPTLIPAAPSITWHFVIVYPLVSELVAFTKNKSGPQQYSLTGIRL